MPKEKAQQMIEDYLRACDKLRQEYSKECLESCDNLYNELLTALMKSE